VKYFFYLFSSLLLLMPLGCSGKIDLGLGYQKTSQHFLQAMRWKDYRGAAVHFKEKEEGLRLLEYFEAARDLNIVEAEYLYSHYNKADQTATSKLLLKYYLLPSTRIREWSWEMKWELLAADAKQPGTWQILEAPVDYP